VVVPSSGAVGCAGDGCCCVRPQGGGVAVVGVDGGLHCRAR
jgi:hypothetical protein